MPCGGCEERRKAIAQAWQRIKGLALMSNAERSAVAQREREREATEARTAQQESLMEQQRQIASVAITRRVR